MAAWLDNVRFNPTLGGTTDWTYSSAVSGYQSPASAGAVNGRAYKYFAIDTSNNWELGEGAWNSGTGVLPRTTVIANSLGTTAKINFAAAPQIAIVALKEDMISVEEANSFTATQQAQARTNINAQPNKVYAENTTWTTGSAAMAAAATTVPQNTDGTQLLSAAITPTLTTSKLLIRINGSVTSSGTPNLWVSLFQGAAASAIASAVIGISAASTQEDVALTMEVTAGGTSAITFSVRIGNFNGASSTWAINGNTSGSLLGGSMRWTMTIEEIKQ
jgi:hypothetical protein